MDTFLFIYLLAIIFRTKPKDLKKKFGKNYFSKEQCNALRGMLAALVMLHHISNETENGYFFRYLYHLGVFGTVGFFVISGYGLTLSLTQKGNSYLKGFIPKRLGVIIIPYTVFFAVYFIYAHLTDGCSFQTALRSLTNGNPIVKNSWYITAIVYLYIIYYISAKLFFVKGKKTLFIFGNITGVVLYMIACKKLHYGMWWYNTAHCFIVGIILAMYEKEALSLIKKHYRTTLTINILVLILLLAAKDKTTRGSDINYTITLFFALTFAVFIPLVCLKLDFSKNKLMTNLGKFSFELYLLHGLVMDILLKINVFDNNEIVFSAATLIFSFAGAYLINMPIEKLCCLYRRYLNKIYTFRKADS